MSSLAAAHSFSFALVNVATFALSYDPADALVCDGLYFLFSLVVFFIPCYPRNFRAINLELLVCRAQGLGFETISYICDAKLLDFHSAVYICAFCD